jgi:integrase
VHLLQSIENLVHPLLQVFKFRPHVTVTHPVASSRARASADDCVCLEQTARTRYHAALRCTKILDVDVKFHTLRHTFSSHYEIDAQSTHGALGAESGAPRVV